MGRAAACQHPPGKRGTAVGGVCCVWWGSIWVWRAAVRKVCVLYTACTAQLSAVRTLSNRGVYCPQQAPAWL